MKHKIICGILAFCMMAAIPHSVSAASQAPDSIYDITPVTSKASSQSIRLSWDSSWDASVKYYYVMRRGTKDSKGSGTWKTLAKITSDGKAGGPSNSYTDQLKSSLPQQYEYKICTLSKDKATDTRSPEYQEATDQYAALGTNIKICIDPGHYASLNNNYDLEDNDGKYPYSEAGFNLKTGIALQAELKQAYGIDSFLTRTSPDISLAYNGKTYTNENLDQKNIAVRGYTAKTKGCDFFISLHTNSTSRLENPWSQPKSVNKVYVFVNSAAHASSRGMAIANTIGTELTAYNQAAGIQTAKFVTRKRNAAANFSNLENDASNGHGTVIHRKGSSGSDYYGVLRGSSSAGIEGLLVEHAFHATLIVRKLADASPELYENWAACDAYGIAKGFGFAVSPR